MDAEILAMLPASQVEILAECALLHPDTSPGAVIDILDRLRHAGRIVARDSAKGRKWVPVATKPPGHPAGDDQATPLFDRVTRTWWPPQEPIAVHGIQPTTVLRADQKAWQQRRKQWELAGIVDTAGREHIDVAVDAQPGLQPHLHGRASAFDPVLAEAHYRWYCPPGGRVLDPCAGGATRGLVAAHLGLSYVGIDLSATQVAANEDQYERWSERGLIAGSAEWIVGAAQDVLPALDGAYDYVLTCPPYHDVEVYSDDPRDLSRMSWEDFVRTLREVVAHSVRLLASDAFATWVVGDVRAPTGALRRLPSLVDSAHEDTAVPLLNDGIYVSPLGSKRWNLGRSWRPTRSATRVHQYAHTYVKGDRRAASARLALPHREP